MEDDPLADAAAEFEIEDDEFMVNPWVRELDVKMSTRANRS